MHNSTGVWERELKVRMEVCTKSWGSRWDCWYGQDITGSVGWASSGINKCKCWLSAHSRSRHHTAGPALTTCTGAESICCFLETCARNSSTWVILTRGFGKGYIFLVSIQKTNGIFALFKSLSTFLSLRQSWSHPDVSFSPRAANPAVTLWCQTNGPAPTRLKRWP